MTELKDEFKGEMKDRLQDRFQNLSSEQQRFFDDAQERVAQIYDISRDFVRENQTAVLFGLGALLGVIGFFIGRGSKSDQ